MSKQVFCTTIKNVVYIINLNSRLTASLLFYLIINKLKYITRRFNIFFWVSKKSFVLNTYEEKKRLICKK